MNKQLKGKNLIIEKSFELLLQKGYDNVSVSDIQKETGISRGLIYHYYANKEELFNNVIIKYFTDFFIPKYTAVSGLTISELIDHTENHYTNIFKKINTSTTKVELLFQQTLNKNQTFKEAFKNAQEAEEDAWLKATKNSISKGDVKEGLVAKNTSMIFVYLIKGAWIYDSIDEDPTQTIKKCFNTLRKYHNQIK